MHKNKLLCLYTLIQKKLTVWLLKLSVFSKSQPLLRTFLMKQIAMF